MPKTTQCLYCRYLQLVTEASTALTKHQRVYYEKASVLAHAAITKPVNTRTLHPCSIEHRLFMNDIRLHDLGRLRTQVLIKEQLLKTAYARLGKVVDNMNLLISIHTVNNPEVRNLRRESERLEKIVAQRLRRLREAKAELKKHLPKPQVKP